MMKTNNIFKFGIIVFTMLMFTGCSGVYYGTSGGNYRSNNYYNGGHGGWGNSYYNRGPNYIIIDAPIDRIPDIPDIDLGPPEAAQLPDIDW